MAKIREFNFLKSEKYWVNELLGFIRSKKKMNGYGNIFNTLVESLYVPSKD